MVTIRQLEKIKDFAIELDWNSTFGGKSKGNRHLFRVVNIAKELAKNKNVNSAIVEAGSWLHDTNLELTIEGDTMINKDKVIAFLEEIDLDERDIVQILSCIESHDGQINAKTMEAKIVHDADTLDKMGPLGIIRETWKRSQLGWNTEKICEHLPLHIEKRKNNLNYEEAKIKAEYLTKNLNFFFLQLKRQLKE